MNLPVVSLVFRKELKETLRDRRTLMIMVLLPLVIYPLVVLALGQGVAATRMDQKEKVSRVGLVGKSWTQLEQALADHDRIQLVDGAAGDARLQRRELDLLVVVPATAKKDLASGGTVALTLRYDQSQDRSSVALNRAREVIDALEVKLREARFKGRGLPLTLANPVDLERENIASSQALGAKVLAGALPLMVVLMVLLGAFYPAIDLTAGEKERGTLETLLVAPVKRTDIIAGKFLVVTTIAMVTGLLNLGSIGLSFFLGFRTYLDVAKLPIDLPWSSLAMTVVALVPASIFYAAVMLAVAALARSFKEAQNLLTPIYMVFMMPSMLAMLPWIKLTPLAALVPAVNIALLTREIITGNMQPLPVVLCIVSSVIYTGIALALAARIYSSERLLFAPEPLSTRLRGKKGRGAGGPPLRTTPEPREAAIVLMMVMALILFVGQRLQLSDLVSGLLITEWVLIAMPVVLLMKLGRFDPRAALALVPVRHRVYLGAALAGLSGWVLVGVMVEQLQQRVMPIPQEMLDEMQRLLFSQERALWLDLFLLALSPAVCEELLFRGLLLRGTRQALGDRGAILLNGVLFGVFHLSIYRFFPTFTLGLVLAYIALRSGSLYPCILFHFLNNGCAVVVGRFLGDAKGNAPPELVNVPLVLAAAAVFALGIALVGRWSRRAEPGPDPGAGAAP